MDALNSKVFTALEAKDFNEANRQMLILSCLLIEDQAASSIDANINMLFSKGTGVYKFLNEMFKSSNVNNYTSIKECLQVVYIWLNSFPQKLSDEIITIISMTRVILSSSKLYKYKDVSARILLTMITSEEIEMDENIILSIYGNVKTWLDDKSLKSNSMKGWYIQLIGALTVKSAMKSKLEEVSSIILNFIRGIVSRNTGGQDLLKGGYVAAQLFILHAEFTSEQLLLLYEHMKRDVQFKDDYGKRQGSREVVNFAACNAMLFAIQLENDALEWHHILQKWFTCSSRDDSKAGYEALVAINRAIGQTWAQSETCPRDFLLVLANAKQVLFQQEGKVNETKLAIFTIGYLAPTAAKYLDSREFRDLFLFLLERIEYLIFVQTGSSANVLTGNSCDYVEAISSFLESLQSDIQHHMIQFKRVTIVLIKMFPKVLPNNHQIVVNALQRMFTSIAQADDRLFQDFVKDVIKQGVIWTCSHKLAQEVELFDLDDITYKMYLPLWQGILQVNDDKGEKLGLIQIVLWDKLLKNLLYMSEKLNLRIKVNEINAEDGTDGTIGLLEAEKCNDFIVFANLCDFYCDLIISANPDCLKPWFDVLFEHLMRKSLQLPLVSGFYKLMATLLLLFQKVDYFDSARLEQKEHVRLTYENVKNYLQHALKQVHRFKNDLQFACVLLILRMPLPIIMSIHHDYSALYITAFKLGQHNFELANIALDTLTQWFKKMPENISHPLLRKTVPCLDAYLRNQFVVGDAIYVEGRKRKKYGQRKLNVEEEPELVQLQHKVLRFLAILPNAICLELNATSSELRLRKEDTRLLKVNLPFGERHLGLWLDPFLDRVLELSVESTDRKVRITACEFLHSIIVIFLGTSAQMNTCDFDLQLEKIITSMLPLASDQDITVVDLFKPLLFQMAHWYAHPKHSVSSHSRSFIKCLMDGVSNENDGAVRDLSGNVLREFLAWTRKQNSKDTLKHNLNNVKLIIDHLKQFCLHPDEAKRYGATVIFSNIYRELREEDAFVDAFWLEILYAFVMNLFLVTPTTRDDALLKEINLCLDRVTRCLIQKRFIFSQSRTERSVPPKFNGNTFQDAAIFLLQHTSQINVHCRTKCMEIFKALPPDTVVSALKNYNLMSYMHDLNTTLFFEDVKTIEDVLRYFASLICFIDGHVFITQLSPSFDHGDSIMWQVLNKLIDGEFKALDLKALQVKFGISNDVLVRRVKDEFGYYRSKLVEKVLDLYDALLSAESTSKDLILNDNSWDFFSDYLFDYHTLGLLDLTHSQWEETAGGLWKLFLNTMKCNKSALQTLAMNCRCAMSTVEQIEQHFTPECEVNWHHRQILRGLILLQRIDKNKCLELDQLCNTFPFDVLYKVLGFDKMEDSEVLTIPKLKDSQREYFTLRLELMLDEESNPNYTKNLTIILNALCVERLIYSTESKTTLAQGVFLFLLFKKTILKHTLRENRLFSTLALIANESSIDLRVTYYKEYLKHVYNTPQLKSNCQIQDELVKSVEHIWPALGFKAEDGECINDDVCLELVHDLRLIVDQLSSVTMFNTIVHILRKPQSSEVQQVHHLTRVSRILGMVAPRGWSRDIGKVLKKMKDENAEYFTAPSKRVTTTLFIKTLFDSTNYSFCLNFFTCALDFYISVGNDFEVDADFCAGFMAKVPHDLQMVLLDAIYAMGSEYTFNQNVVLTLCVANLLAYCDYKVFEEFYIKHIKYIIDGFSTRQLMDKIISCIMLNRLFGNIKIGNFEDLSCKITKAHFNTVSTGTELSKLAASLLFNACKEPLHDCDDPEEYRLYQCYAYNAATTLVCNTRKDKQEVYRMLFHRVNQYEEDILWTKLVPSNMSFDFEIINEEIPRKKKVLLDIRTHLPDSREEEYIQSQNLFLSTLAEDITNYDFTNVCVRHEEAANLNQDRMNAMSVEMDDEDINKHVCMLPILGVIKHMHENNLLPAEAPRWVHDIASMLIKSKTPMNVRQFLCKVIENAQLHLKCYADILIPGIIKTVCETSTTINALAADCVFMLITTWKDHLPSIDDTTELIKFLMTNLWHERTDVFKYNVNLLKTTVETYRQFTLDPAFVDSLFPDNPADKSTLFVIHIINILLANNISPFPLKLKKFCTRMSKILMGPHHQIYLATAETLGLGLKFLDDTNHTSLQPLKELIVANLETLFRDRSQISKPVDVLEAIAKNYPDICPPLLPTIQRKMDIKESLESSKTAYLRIYLKCIKKICDSGYIHKIPLCNLLSSSALDTVIVALEIILASVEFITITNAKHLVEGVVTLPNSNPVCRTIRIDILIAFYTRFYQDNGKQSEEIIQMVKEPLISGFLDTELDIRQKIFSFWTGDDMIPCNLEERVLFLLDNLYDNNNEESFLSFCNSLILHDIRDSGEPIFTIPLYQCDFKDYEVKSNWRSKNTAMIPMFTVSEQTQKLHLRATQSYEFERTQILATQRKSFIQSASVMSFGSMPQSTHKDSIFKNPNDMDVQGYKVKKWRFFKDKANVSKMHAIREIYKGKTIEKKKVDAKKMKEEQVKIYRKYRTGDYPDIQIGVKAVIDTLKELSKCDGHIAQILYKSLFDAIVVIAANDDLICHACNAIQKMFTSSTMFDPVCMGVFLQIALEHRQSMRFPADLIKTVATKSGNLSYGCLLLEEYLTYSEAAEPSWDTLHWIRLADLYKKIEEWDAVQGIFASKIPCPDELLLAVKAESEHNWDVARKYYMELSIKDADYHRNDFYYEALFKCSEELCDWKEIERRCLETTRSNTDTIFDALWTSEWNKEVILPQYIRSQMRVIDKRSDFDVIIKEAMKDNIKKEILRNEFSDELALLYLDRMKVKLAGNYAENYAKKFLKMWMFVKPSYSTMQNQILLTMKNCAEISVLLGMYDKLNKDSFYDIIGEVTKIWQHSNSNNDTISTHHLTTRITIRESFLHLIDLKLRSLLNVREHTLVSTRLSNISFEAEVNIIKQALQQNNYSLAKHFLSRNYGRSENNYRHPITCLLYGKVVLIKVLRGKVAAIAKTKHYVEAFKAHQKCVTQFNVKEKPSLAIDSALYLLDLCKIVGSTPLEDEMDLRIFQSFVQDHDLNRFSDFLSYGFENLRDTLHQLDVLENVDRVQLADAFLILANEYATRGEGYENRYLECALKSMQYGSEKARLGFPKLLGVSGMLAIYKTQFIKQTSLIPTYMFISWIPQLLAFCDTEKVSLVKHIVINLAMEYPNSIIYAYKLSRKKFTYVFEETLGLTHELDEILHNELVDKMLAALKYVAVPATIIRTAISKLHKCSTEETFKQAADKIEKLFSPEEDPIIKGEQYEHVLKYQTTFTELINAPFDKDAIKRALSEIQIPSAKYSTDLGRYSPWLNYFHASDYEQEIEVPGCYTGNCRPLPHYHPKISKFSADVTVLHSVFKPIRITIYANDVREYRFLVKYGEDLRQDQRIEQLFKLMNVALSSDVKCRERNLQVSTFEVIPLTDELGFIQWVDETEILKKVIINRSRYPALEQKLKKCLNDMYSRALTIRTREQVCFDYKQLVDFLPRDALRKSLWNISPDPETFFALRLTFIRSYAVMCITNWLLGIGDRHLDNILLNMNTGNVIGIDFGHAFGSATQQQGVAELVPFRLTPQILNIMTPLKEVGPLQQAMVNTLRVLRENCDTLLSTMDIFIMEPTINWLDFMDDTWNPTIIMELARAKFHGTNPINIMLREVEARRHTQPPKELYIDCLAILLNSLKLDEEDGILSVHSQVESLIAMATDANLLGRMYHGWESWV